MCFLFLFPASITILHFPFQKPLSLSQPFLGLFFHGVTQQRQVQLNIWQWFSPVGECAELIGTREVSGVNLAAFIVAFFHQWGKEMVGNITKSVVAENNIHKSCSLK